MLSDFTKVIFRRIRLIKIDRNFLVFLFFLLVSIVFWFMQTIKEATEVTIAYDLKIEDVPPHVVFTSTVPKKINVTYDSKGWNAIYYKFMRNDDYELSVSYKEASTNGSKISINSNQLRRAAMKNHPAGMAYKSTSPAKLDVFYSNGQHKRVPVVFNGRITTSEGRYVCGTYLMPDSVDVYASSHLYDGIKSVKTASVTFENLEDTVMTSLPLLVPRGVKAIPDSIKAQICVDIFTDKTLQIPVYSENVPSNRILRTFPLKVSVTFLVSATLYDEITEEKFLLSVDYEDTKTNKKRLKVNLRQQPDNIRHLRISPEYVEYVIEQETE